MKFRSELMGLKFLAELIARKPKLEIIDSTPLTLDPNPSFFPQFHNLTLIPRITP